MKMLKTPRGRKGGRRRGKFNLMTILSPIKEESKEKEMALLCLPSANFNVLCKHN